VPYWQNVVRSFEIPWRHKYLWLLALFAGESGGGFNFSYSQGTGSTSNQTPSQAAQQAATWLNQHAGLLVLLFVLWLLILVGLFILAAACEGATIRGSAEHDAERPFGLGRAWRAGVGTMWVIVRFRLLLIALILPVLVIAGLLIAGFVLAIVKGLVLTAVIVGIVGALFFLAAFVYAVYISLLDRLGSRTAILEQQQAIASLSRAHRLLLKRFGRVLLVWLISVAVGIVVGIATGLVLVVVALPAVIAGIAAASGAGAGLWFIVAFLVLLWLVIAIPVSAFVGAQSSTYWTLAFRRMEIDLPPAYAPAAPPPAPA